MTILLEKWMSQKEEEKFMSACIFALNLHACIYIAGMISNENSILSKGK